MWTTYINWAISIYSREIQLLEPYNFKAVNLDFSKSVVDVT